MNPNPDPISGARTRRALVFFACLAALVPIARTVGFLARNGENNLADDDFLILPLVDHMLSGTYPWRHYFHDTFQTGHSWAVMVGLQALAARFLHWDIFGLLSLGVAATCLKLLLLYDLLTRSLTHRWKILLLPLLSFLVFAPAQISTLEWSVTSLMQSFTHLGFLFGLWGLARWSGRWTGAVAAMAGGTLATLSSGAGPLVWPVFLLGMYFFHFRSWKHYLAVAAAALVSSWPYLYFLLVSKPAYSLYTEPYQAVNPLNFGFLLRGIGWPLSPHFEPQLAFLRGGAGLILCSTGLGLFAAFTRRNREGISPALPSLLVVAYSLANLWEISAFRPQIFPWYAYQFMLFWIGLLGLVVQLLASRRGPRFAAVWGWTCLALLAWFYLDSNLAFADKSNFLKLRSPSSVSCLELFASAPTYCEPRLFTWDVKDYVGFMGRAEILQRREWSVFGPSRRESLQGDFILDSVRLHRDPDAPGIYWVPGRDAAAKAPFSDYRRLNLFLHGGNSVAWTLHLPPNLQRATLHSALTFSSTTPHDPNADGVYLEIRATAEGRPDKVMLGQYLSPDQRDWLDFEVPLTEFRGQSVTLHWTMQPWGNANHDWALLRHPYVESELDPKRSPPPPDIALRPANTDLSPEFVRPTDGDFDLNVADPGSWLTANLEFLPAPATPRGTWQAGRDPQLAFSHGLDLPLKDYSHFYVKLSVSPEIADRDLQIFYRLDGQAAFDDAHSVVIPLLADGNMHAYSYDLKLLEAPPEARLTGIRLDPVRQGSPGKENRITVSDFRLIRREESR